MQVAVLYTEDMQETLRFFSTFGMSFVKEKHGDGPEHYACQSGNRVLEIYPRKTTSGNKDTFVFLSEE